MANEYGGFGTNLGQPDILSGAASGALATPESNAQVSDLITNILRSKTGEGGGLVFGPTAGQPSMPLPPPQINQPGIPQGNFGSTGERKRAEQQALFSSIGNILKTATQRHYEQKVQKMSKDFEVLMGAMNGYNEAKLAGNNNAMQHNANIINQIMSDPKKAKELAKAFDVNLNPMAGEGKGEKKKQNPANDALKQAFQKDMQDFQQKKTMLSPQANAFIRGLPQQAQADPRLAIMEQLTKSGVLPKGGEILKAQTDLAKIIEHAKTAGLNRENKLDLAKMLVDAKDRQTQAMVWRGMMQAASARDRAEIMAEAMKYRADKMYKGIIDNPHWKALQEHYKAQDAKGGDKTSKAIRLLMDGVNSQLKTLNSEIAAAKAAKDTKKLGELQQKLQEVQNMQQLVITQAGQNIGIDPSQITSIPGLDENEVEGLLGLFKDSENEEDATESSDDNTDK